MFDINRFDRLEGKVPLNRNSCKSILGSVLHNFKLETFIHSIVHDTKINCVGQKTFL